MNDRLLDEMHADWMEIHRNDLAPDSDEIEFMRLDMALKEIESEPGRSAAAPIHFDLGQYTPPEAALASMSLRGWRTHRAIHSTSYEFRLNGFQAHVYYTEDCRVMVDIIYYGLKASVQAKLAAAKARRGISRFARAMVAETIKAERRRARSMAAA
jgi:hypothetical protein